MSGTSWLAFKPRDTVFVRDGRSFNAAVDALAETVRPGPTTIAGAVGEAFNPAEVRGPAFSTRRHTCVLRKTGPFWPRSPRRGSGMPGRRAMSRSAEEGA